MNVTGWHTSLSGLWLRPEPTPLHQKVALYASPWVSGTRAEHYFGPISVKRFVPGSDEDDWLQGQLDLLEALQRTALALGANAVIGVEIYLDPFTVQEGLKGLGLHAVGTAARLRALV